LAELAKELQSKQDLVQITRPSTTFACRFALLRAEYGQSIPDIILAI
jgi:hypothetical protein